MIFKIATQSAWDEALSVGAFRGSDARQARRLHPSFGRPSGRGHGGEIFSQSAGPRAHRFRRGKAQTESEMGAGPRRRFLPALLCAVADSRGAVDPAVAARRRDGVPIIPAGSCLMLDAMFDLARPMLFALVPETAHELTLKSLEMGVYPRSAAPDDAVACRFALGSHVSESPRHRGRLRQGRARRRCRPRHGMRLRRGRNDDASCAIGQSRRRASSASSPTAASSTGSASTTPATRRPSTACARAARAAVSSPSTSAPTRTAPIAPPTTSRASRRSTTSRATSRSTSPRPTRRACATCRRPPRSTSFWGASWPRARALVAAGKPKRPVIVKLAPDIAEEDIEPIAARSARAAVDGIAVSNTTLARDGPHRSPMPAKRRALRPPALSPLDRHAGARPRGDRGPRAAHRHRRHRQRRGGARQDRGRRHALAALHGAHL